MATAFPALSIAQPANPIEQLAGVMQVRNEFQQSQLNDIKLQEEQQEQRSRSALMRIFAANGGDMNQTLSDAVASGQVTPEHINVFRTQAIAAQIQAAKLTEAQLANHKSLSEMAANELDSIKNTPPQQQQQAIKDSYGRLLQAGADPKWLGPIVQNLAANPTPENFQQHEIALMGERWANENEMKNRELQSMPTISQAQQKNKADLDKAVSDSLIAQREYANMPSPTEAASARAAEFLKTQSETAKNRAETANALVDAQMKKVKLVYATDASGQMNLLPVASANVAGMKIYQEAPPDAYANEKKSAIEIGSVQSGISEYRAAANDPKLKSDSDQDKAMAYILSNNKLLGDLADKIPLGARSNDVATAVQNAGHWNELDPEHQRLLSAYLTAKIGAMNMQKLQGGSIGRNQEVIHAEFSAVPSPLQSGSPSFNEQVDQFQKRLDVASQGSVKVPGVRTPQDIRADIEARSANQASAEARANQVFQQNRAAAQTGQYRGTPSQDTGRKQYQVGMVAEGLPGGPKTVTKVYPDGTFDAQ